MSKKIYETSPEQKKKFKLEEPKGSPRIPMERIKKLIELAFVVSKGRGPKRDELLNLAETLASEKEKLTEKCGK